MNCVLYITPHKELHVTQIRLFLKNSTWDTQDLLAQKIKELMSHPGGKKAHITDATSLDIEVDYEALETFLELLAKTLQSEAERLRLCAYVIEKKILIEKLGGWFDV